MSSGGRMERSGRRAKAGSLSGLAGGLGLGLPTPGGSVRRQRSLEWAGDRYSSSDDDPPHPPLADRVFASLLAQATQQFDNEQRRIYGSETGEESRYTSSPLRQSSPFPHESTNRRYCRRNRNSKGEEIFTADTNSANAGGTLTRRNRRLDDFTPENNTRVRVCLNNGTISGGQSERECESPPEPAPPEVPPRGPSLHVTLRHRPPDPPQEPDRLYLSEDEFEDETDEGSSSMDSGAGPSSENQGPTPAAASDDDTASNVTATDLLGPEVLEDLTEQEAIEDDAKSGEAV